MRTLANCEVFDPDENCWKEINPMTTPRSNASACQFKDRFVYVFGGYTSNQSKMLNSIEKLNTHLNLWMPIEDIKTPSPLFNSIACPINNEFICIFGGAILLPTNSTPF